MRTEFVRVALAFAAAGFVMFALPTSRGASDSEAAAPKANEPKHESPLHLSAAKRDAAGIVVERARATTLAPEIDAFGRVLDPTPYVALVAEAATARATLAASEKELARVQKLFAAGGNASAQAVEAAESAAARDRAAVASAELRLVAGWGRNLAEHTDLTAWREQFAKGAALIRIDLLPGASVSNEVKRARVSLIGANDSSEAEILGPAPIADPQVQGESFLAVVRERSLPSGAALRASVAVLGDPIAALLVPRRAIVYHQGSAWLFVLGKDDTFERKLVALGRGAGDEVAIASGIDADDQIATAGAQQLLSAELQAGGAPDER